MNLDACDAVALPFEGNSGFALSVWLGGRAGGSVGQGMEGNRRPIPGKNLRPRFRYWTRTIGWDGKERDEIFLHGALAMDLGWLVSLLATRLPSWTLSCTDTRRLISSPGRLLSKGCVSPTPDTL